MNTELNFKRTRFAPTPSGYLHIGNIYSFALTSALAKKTNARILLRIDDADLERTQKRYVQDIFDTLDFLEIPYDEGPRSVQEYESEYSQVHRMDMYRDTLQYLREAGKVFACTCSRTDVQRLSPENIYSGTCLNKDIGLDTERASWRAKTGAADKIIVKTFDAGHMETTLPDIMQYFVVKKRDGFPGYQLTSLVDDCFYGVDLVVRGADLWASTLAQVWLSARCGKEMFTNTVFYHHPLFTDADGNKLSKSEGATSVHHLREQKKTSADIYTLVAKNLNMNVAPRTWEELISLL
jgi:glutamyl-tRNA synthetase